MEIAGIIYLSREVIKPSVEGMSPFFRATVFRRGVLQLIVSQGNPYIAISLLHENMVALLFSARGLCYPSDGCPHVYGLRRSFIGLSDVAGSPVVIRQMHIVSDVEDVQFCEVRCRSRHCNEYCAAGGTLRPSSRHNGIIVCAR